MRMRVCTSETTYDNNKIGFPAMFTNKRSTGVAALLEWRCCSVSERSGGLFRVIVIRDIFLNGLTLFFAFALGTGRRPVVFCRRDFSVR